MPEWEVPIPKKLLQQALQARAARNVAMAAACCTSCTSLDRRPDSRECRTERHDPLDRPIAAMSLQVLLQELFRMAPPTRDAGRADGPAFFSTITESASTSAPDRRGEPGGRCSSSKTTAGLCAAAGEAPRPQA